MSFSKSRLVASWLNSIYTNQSVEEIQSPSTPSGGTPVQYTNDNGFSNDVLDVVQDDIGNRSTQMFHITEIGGFDYANPVVETVNSGIVVKGANNSYTATYSDGVMTNGIGFKPRNMDIGQIGQGATYNPSIVSNFNSTDDIDRQFADMLHMRCFTPMSYVHALNETTGRYPVNLITMSGSSLSPNFSNMRSGQEILLIISLNGAPIYWPSGLTWRNNGGVAPTVAAGQTLSVAILRTNAISPNPDAFNAWVLGNN